VSADATFEALGLDSLDIVELTLALEDRTGVKLGDEDLEQVRTVQDAIDKVKERQA
jgi:acyl carrier protein